MTLLRKLLEKMKLRNAQSFQAASMVEIQSTSIRLVQNGFMRIPRDYLNFLSLSDGLVYNDLELFCVGSHERAATVFNQPELLSYQEKNILGKTFSKRLILGRKGEIWICYDGNCRCYALIDRWSLQTILQFPRFEDLLYYLIYQLEG